MLVRRRSSDERLSHTHLTPLRPAALQSKLAEQTLQMDDASAAANLFEADLIALHAAHSDLNAQLAAAAAAAVAAAQREAAAAAEGAAALHAQVVAAQEAVRKERAAAADAAADARCAAEGRQSEALRAQAEEMRAAQQTRLKALEADAVAHVQGVTRKLTEQAKQLEASQVLTVGGRGLGLKAWVEGWGVTGRGVKGLGRKVGAPTVGKQELECERRERLRRANVQAQGWNPSAL